MRKTQTYFEQISVEKLKKLLVLPENQEVTPLTSSRLHSVLRCTICSQPVAIETAKTDSNGKAIHEECYIMSVAGETVTSGARAMPQA